MATLKNTTINDTGFFTLPAGNTAQRPGSPLAGMVRFNTDQDYLEGFDSINWVQLGETQIVSNGLQLYLDAGISGSYPGTGTTWFDLSGKDYNGTLVNGVTFTRTNNGGLIFDGSNDYVELLHAIIGGTGDFTINQWIQSTADETGGTIFGNYPAGTLQCFFGRQYIGLWLNNSSAYLGTPPYNTLLPEFTTAPIMFTACRSGSTTFIYLNAVEKKQGSSSANIGASSFRIGTNTVTTEQFAGTVYVTQVYNRTLSQIEILQNFNADRRRFGL